MRKLLSFVLLVVLGLPSALPLLAATQDADAGLPACCRRHGAHHCSMRNGLGAPAAAAAAQGTGQRGRTDAMTARGEVCPMRATLLAASHADPLLLPSATQRDYAGLRSHPAVHAQTESRWRVARERASGKRGPPTQA